MSNNKILLVFLIFATVFFFQSCEKNQDLFTEPALQDEIENSGELVKLGKKLDNPYTVENMQKAYNNIKQTGAFKSSIQIQKTHYYVRFLPANIEEYDKLALDSTLELFDYPLDYELEEGGTYYHDPELSESQITWQYCAVPVDFNFPSIEYEIIEELFLPETLVSDEKSNSSEWTILDELETEALKITGNLEETHEKWGRTKWNPSGTIKVQDDILGGYVPVPGAKARAYSWFTTKTDLTNSSGYFYISHKFKGHVNYSIKWEREDYDLRSGNWGQAYYNGPRLKEQAWTLNIGKGGLSFVYAHTHHAAYDYYYNNSFGIKTPPKNSFWKRKVKIGAFDKDGRAFFNPVNRWTTFPEIKIYKKNSSGSLRNARRIYGTAIHELAHSSHWDIDKWDFYHSDDIVVESWAVGVSNVFTTALYGSDNWSWNAYTFAHITGHFESKYTPLVIDLMDNINQRATHGNSTNYPIDRVSGYTISQIENALKNKRTLTQWRDRLKFLYNNNTENNVDELFNNYINL